MIRYLRRRNSSSMAVQRLPNVITFTLESDLSSRWHGGHGPERYHLGPGRAVKVVKSVRVRQNAAAVRPAREARTS